MSKLYSVRVLFKLKKKFIGNSKMHKQITSTVMNLRDGYVYECDAFFMFRIYEIIQKNICHLIHKIGVTMHHFAYIWTIVSIRWNKFSVVCQSCVVRNKCILSHAKLLPFFCSSLLFLFWLKSTKISGDFVSVFIFHVLCFNLKFKYAFASALTHNKHRQWCDLQIVFSIVAFGFLQFHFAYIIIIWSEERICCFSTICSNGPHFKYIFDSSIRLIKILLWCALLRHTKYTVYILLTAHFYFYIHLMVWPSFKRSLSVVPVNQVFISNWISAFGER